METVNSRETVPVLENEESVEADQYYCGQDEIPKVSLFGYLWDEINRGQSLPDVDQYKEKCERVYIFMKIMGRMESLMFYGLLCCTDIFLSVFTIIPIRCIVTFIKLFFWPFRRVFLGPRKLIHHSQMMDIARVLLVFITCFNPYSPLKYFNTSVIYHTIRSQELLKLYIIYNMLEVADRLIASIGQDTMDTLNWSIAHPKRPLQLIFHFLLAVLYMFMHSSIMLLQATTLNVAFNNHNKVLLILMMSNNFIEIKGSVFKRYDKNNLFQVTCADIRERFHLFWLLYIVLIRNLSQHQWNIISLYDIMPYVCLIMGAELVIDWMKHAFILKFNNLSVNIYSEYRNTLADDFIKSQDPTNDIEYSDHISRRMAYSPLPLAAVVIHISLISFKLSGPAGAKVLAAIFINLLLFKIISGLLLMKESSKNLPDEKTSENSASPKLAKILDPYQQLKRSASTKSVVNANTESTKTGPDVTRHDTDLTAIVEAEKDEVFENPEIFEDSKNKFESDEHFEKVEYLSRSPTKSDLRAGLSVEGVKSAVLKVTEIMPLKNTNEDDGFPPRIQ